MHPPTVLLPFHPRPGPTSHPRDAIGPAGHWSGVNPSVLLMGESEQSPRCSPPTHVRLPGGTCAQAEIQSLIPETVSQEEHEDRARHGMSPGTISNDTPNSIAFTATADGRICPPPSPRHCRGQTRRHRRTSLWSSLGLQTQQREGDFWSSSTGHCRSRCQEWEEDEQLCRPERAVAPVSAAHTETVGKPGASCLLLRQDWGSACPMAMTSTFSQRGQWLGNMP